MRSRIVRTLFGTLMGLVILTHTGCRGQNPNRPDAAGPAWSVAIVPFTNQSGSDALDALAVTDEFYTELQLAGEGAQVLPVNRVLAAMSSLSMSKVATPSDVELLANMLMVDAVIVGTITQYDPYFPPKVGMMVQLYDRKKWAAHDPLKHIDPGRLARSGTRFDLEPPAELKPISQVIRIVDAGDKKVIERLKQYADKRNEQETSPWANSWQKYTTSKNYVRFVSHEVIGELLSRRRSYLAGRPPEPQE